MEALGRVEITEAKSQGFLKGIAVEVMSNRNVIEHDHMNMLDIFDDKPHVEEVVIAGHREKKG